MNDELKAVHMQTITHPDAVRMYDDLCAACEMREGGMTGRSRSSASRRSC